MPAHRLMRAYRSPSLFSIALLLSAVSHAGVLTAWHFSGNTRFGGGGGGPVTVELVDTGVPGAGARPEHQHRKHRVPSRRPSVLVPEQRGPRVASREAAPVDDSSTDRAAIDGGGSGSPGAALGEEEVDVPARLIAMPRLSYPPAMAREGREGDVVLFLVLDTLGKVVEARVMSGAGPEFDASALDATKDLRFTPAEKDGHRVPVHIHWTCRFRLED